MSDVAQNNTTAEHVAESDVLRQASKGKWILGEPNFGWEDGVEKDYVPVYATARDDEEILAACFGSTPEEALANARLMAAAKDMAEALQKTLVAFKHGSSFSDCIIAKEFAFVALKKAGAA
jgi:hypothetical protein